MRLQFVTLFAVLTACSTTPPSTPADAPAVEPAEMGAGAGDAAGGPDAATTAATPPDAMPAGDEAGSAELVALPGLAKLTEAQGKVHAMMGKADAQKAVSGVLGDPSASTDTEMVWTAKDGDKCKQLKVQLMGDMTGGVTVADAPCPAGSAE
jgi:hypothetical protein